MMQATTTMCQYDVTTKSKLYLASGSKILNRVYGTGIGYPVRRSDGIILKESEKKQSVTFYKYPKVDSFDLYRTNVGMNISKSIWESI